MTKINLAIIGATGLVGTTFLKVLGESEIRNKIQNLYLFASAKSVGKTFDFDGQKIAVEELSIKNIVGKKIDYAFFSVGENLSKKFASVFVKTGATVIDNSSAFRMHNDVPLIVPEVNFQKTNSKIIANPNCSTIQCMLPLRVLQKNYGIKRIDFCTYQAVSGSGMQGVDDLKNTLAGDLPKFYPYDISQNCLPHIGSFLHNGFTSEEMKMVNETRKILGLPNLKVSATCVRVPIESCHSIAVIAKLKKKFNVEKIKREFSRFENLIVVDNVMKNQYPINQKIVGKNGVLVGRIRADLFDEKTIHFWCVADNIRKGASANGVQILEKLLQ